MARSACDACRAVATTRSIVVSRSRSPRKIAASVSLTTFSRASAFATASPARSLRRVRRASSASPSTPGACVAAQSAPQSRPRTRTGDATTHRIGGRPPRPAAAPGPIAACRSSRRALRPVRCTSPMVLGGSREVASPTVIRSASSAAQAPTCTARLPSNRSDARRLATHEPAGLLRDAGEDLRRLGVGGHEERHPPDRALLLLHPPPARHVAGQARVAHGDAVLVDDRGDGPGDHQTGPVAAHERPLPGVLPVVGGGDQGARARRARRPGGRTRRARPGRARGSGRAGRPPPRGTTRACGPLRRSTPPGGRPRRRSPPRGRGRRASDRSGGRPDGAGASTRGQTVGRNPPPGKPYVPRRVRATVSMTGRRCSRNR